MWWSNRHRRGESKGCSRDGWIDFEKGLGREENAAGARLDPSHNLEQCLPPPPVMMWERCWKKGVRNDIQTEAQHV